MGLPVIAPEVTLPAGEAWPEQGRWTYADYLRLPDDGRRYEVIEGVRSFSRKCCRGSTF